MSIELVDLVVHINFAISALGLGVWFVLGIHWLRAARGKTRLLLLWIGLNVMASLGIRMYQQLRLYEAEGFPLVDLFRMGLNVSSLALAIYLARKWSGAFDQEGSR